MARFEREWLNDLLAKSDIVDVVSDYANIINKGGKLWACCPLHGEKTPSFTVSREKQVFYCFGCHESGNIISFLMKVENLTFIEAVENLAERLNVSLPEQKNNKNYKQEKEKLAKIYEINRQAALFYHNNLYQGFAKDALSYIHGRGIDDKVIKRFGLGYSKDGWSTLVDYLTAKGYKIDEIKQAGLANIKNNKAFDFFRNRIMFPILDVKGNVIGFGGRVMDDSQPKYLNTSDTLAFNKRKNVYALNYIKAIRGLKSVVLTEGYMDVISLYANGVYNAIATLGTAITKEQVYHIKRYAPLVYIAYDGDKAGTKAGVKAVDVLSSVGLDNKVITFEDGADPDEFIRKHGYTAFLQAVKDSMTGIMFKLEVLSKDFDMNDYSDKAKYLVKAALIINALENPVEREQYILHLSKKTGYSLDAIRDQISVKDTKVIHGNNRYENVSVSSDPDDIDELEKKLGEYFLANPKQISIYNMEDLLRYFKSQSIKNVLELINNSVKKGFLPTNAEILTGLNEQDSRIVGKMIVASDEDRVVETDISHIIQEFRTISFKTELDKLYKELETSSDKAMILAKISELNKNLYNIKKKPNDGR